MQHSFTIAAILKISLCVCAVSPVSAAVPSKSIDLLREVGCVRCDREHSRGVMLSEDKRAIGQSHSKESRSFNCVQNSGRSHTVLKFPIMNMNKWPQ